MTRSGKIDHAGICATYDVTPRTMDNWTGLLNFPAPLAGGGWDAQQVDTWVRHNRPQSWPGHTPAPAGPDTAPSAQAPDEAEERPESAAGATRLGKAGLAQRYRMTEPGIGHWTKAKGFPAAGEDGLWDATAVDDWVQKNRAQAWAEYTGAGPVWVKPPPAGNPGDLLDIDEYRVIMGNATRGKPVARSTMHSYKNRGQVPPPDRRPGDRKKPPVLKEMWLRKTIYDDLAKRRKGRRRDAG
ncbi:hypothetical protein [Streptomyces reticuliscabiei]|uniref:hypothetical protein n=1 Tax=Streptomyces reticuliscabiei TaxID=146821 RepID=UPI000A373BF9|nr:hypothetical protein [Streptomyces reticuliscabiei]